MGLFLSAPLSLESNSKGGAEGLGGRIGSGLEGEPALKSVIDITGILGSSGLTAGPGPVIRIMPPLPGLTITPRSGRSGRSGRSLPVEFA